MADHTRKLLALGAWLAVALFAYYMLESLVVALLFATLCTLFVVYLEHDRKKYEHRK